MFSVFGLAGPVAGILASLVITIGIEAGVMAIISRRSDFVYYTVLINVLTNIPLNVTLNIFRFIFALVAYNSGVILFTGVLALLLEGVVIFIEMKLLAAMCGYGIKKALGISMALNVSSYVLGIVLNRAFIYIRFMM